MRDCCIRIGGEAGQGLRSVGQLLSKALHAEGYQLFSNQDYESRIRGGHNFYNIRFGPDPIVAPAPRVDILIALDRETTARHMEALNPNGVVIYDPDIKGIGCDDPHRCFPVPFTEIASRHGNKIMANTVAVAAVWGVLGKDLSLINRLLEDTFADKGDKVIQANIAAAKEGYAQGQAIPQGRFTIPETQGTSTGQILVSGNTAIAIGAIAAGLKFMSAYPMSPSTSITEYVATKGEEFGIHMEQAEDEIAAVVMAIGASYAGLRSMTATSGGGLALMGEAVSMAGMNETPVVIIDAQRPGPATGLPTRTAQEDLNFAIHLGHGEFPKIVLAPGTHEQAFAITAEAFNLADVYQCPVIVLTDQHLADAQRTIPAFDFDSVTIDRGQLVTSDEEAGYPNYRRYRVTESGISDRFIPGFGKSLVVYCTDEHDEEGHLIEDAETRNAQNAKRNRKLELARKAMPSPEIYGDATAELALVCWGTTYGAVKEAVDLLNARGTKAKMIHWTHVWPLNPDTVTAAVAGVSQLIVVEQNYTGQFARLLRAEAGVECTDKILRSDGRPFTAVDILDRLSEIRGEK
ncbi:MAG: 2-oxoacid:acceptor oxidoreductase subunit alpha [Firmicutes bacterium]|nr:2-oxoacid:acceptor oxidoreductase subunit alpha [Bacillota bacterium]